MSVKIVRSDYTEKGHTIKKESEYSPEHDDVDNWYETKCGYKWIEDTPETYNTINDVDNICQHCWNLKVHGHQVKSKA